VQSERLLGDGDVRRANVTRVSQLQQAKDYDVNQVSPSFFWSPTTLVVLLTAVLHATTVRAKMHLESRSDAAEPVGWNPFFFRFFFLVRSQLFHLPFKEIPPIR